MKDVPLRGLLHIIILNLIKDKTIHGGEIYQNLKERFGLDAPRAVIYALLRKAEGDGLLVSSWDIQESGPARRMYTITQDGVEYYQDALERLGGVMKIIQLLLKEKT
jgi:DNA-binding PadR family transcriptional regulator